MVEFIEYILQFGNLNQQQIDLITGKAKILEHHKDDYWEAGKMVKQVGFLTGGIDPKKAFGRIQKRADDSVLFSNDKDAVRKSSKSN